MSDFVIGIMFAEIKSDIRNVRIYIAVIVAFFIFADWMDKL